MATEPSAPSSPILDDFARPDEFPLSQGGRWFSPDVPLKLVGGQARSSSEEFTFVTSLYGVPLIDSDVYVTIAEWAGQLTELYLRSDAAGAGAYTAQVSGGTASIISRSGGTPTTLAEAELSLDDGDAIDFKAQGSLLSLWHRPAEGEWTLVVSVEDSTHESGYIGLSTNSPLTRYEDFGGGGEPVPPPPPLPDATAGLRTFRDAIATDLTDPITHPDDIVICQWWHTERMEAAREVGAKILIYLNLTRAAEPDSEGRYSTGLTLAEAEALGAATEQVDSDAGPICLPGTAGYAEAWAEAAISRAQEVGADGVLCDDMNTPNDGYSGVSDEEWLDQMQACNEVVGPALTAAGLLGIPNMSGALGQRNLEYDGWVEEQFQYYDGGLDEYFVTFPEGNPQPAYMFEEAMAVMHRQQVAGKLYLASTNTDDDDLRRFALGCCLLHTAGGVYAHGLPAGPDYGKETWDGILEEALGLGLPVAEAVPAPGGFRRRFEKGLLLVYPHTQTAEFVFATPSRMVRIQEFPPARIEFLVRDGPGPDSPLISRWAEDAVRDEDAMADIHLRGQVPGGKKEATGTMPRDPRQPWSDLVPYADVDVREPGGELLWSGRFSKAPQSDGDKVSIDGVCVGWQAALADRKGVRFGGVNSRLDRVGDITAQRRKLLIEAGWDPAAISTSVDQFGSGAAGNLPAGISFQWSDLGSTKFEFGELMYDSGGVAIGAVHYDFEGRGAGANDPYVLAQVALSADGTNDTNGSANHEGVSSSHVTLGALPGCRYVFFRSGYTWPAALEPSEHVEVFRFSHIFILGTHGLPLQGTWPNMGLTKKQMTSWLIPNEVPALEVTDESIDDDDALVADAWYPDAQAASDIVTDLYKGSVLDWFVKTRRLLEVRVPGTYGRRWKVTLAGSEFVEDGIDADRLWRTLLVGYPDENGITRYVGPPGSGADLESPLLEITDPDHPAVRAGIDREDLLQLSSTSTPQRALEAGVEWLRHGNELPRSGKAVLRDFVMDEYGVFRPVGQVAEGDAIQFTDSHDQSYRKIVDYDYGHAERATPITVDAPDDSVRALLERYGAALIPLGL